MARFSTFGLSFLVPLTAVIVGCSAGGEQPFGGDGPLGQADDAICPGGSTLEGVDVSIYQGSVNWGSVKAAGRAFAITRISDGTGTLDTTFAANWAGIKSAGMIRGAYQFFEPGEDPTAQANLVIQKVGVLGAGDLPVTADVEVSGGQSAATVCANLQTWLTKVEAGTGKKPMIYTSPGLWSSLCNSTAFGGYPLWVANWGVSCPSLPNGWSNFVFWQYSDSGSVSGIPATVDLDKFNGDQAALTKFAGGGADWAGQFVSQTWPYATMTITMTVNQQMPASITMKNVGQKTWDTNTKLGTTQPRDRMSPFVASDWLAPNRLSHVTGTVPPGQDFKFAFTFQAPNKPGAYDEFYGMVEEGVAWFSDPGQGGPADNVIEAKFQVNEAQYHAEYVSQTFPTLSQAPIMMNVGQTMNGTITLKNVGTATWKAGVTKLAPTPRDKPSPLGGSSWLSMTRVSSPPMDVAPGSSYDFPLELVGNMAGDFTQTFALVEENVTWFADAPLGGGPPDNLLAVHVIVGQGGTGTGGSSGAGGSASGSGGAGGAGAGGGDVGGSTAGAGGSSATGTGGGAHTTGTGASPPINSNGGCSCRAAGDTRDDAPTGAWLAAAGIALVFVRRRRAA